MSDPISDGRTPPSPQEVIEIMLERAWYEADCLDAPYPDRPVDQGVKMAEAASSASMLINLVPDEQGRTTAAHVRVMWVKGRSEEGGPSPPREHFVVFHAPTEWHHTAWRVAFGDRKEDTDVREYLKKDDPEALVRLIQWLTPAGLYQMRFLRGDYSTHSELMVVDDYHQFLLDNSDLVQTTQEVWV